MKFIFILIILHKQRNSHDPADVIVLSQESVNSENSAPKPEEVQVAKKPRRSTGSNASMNEASEADSKGVARKRTRSSAASENPPGGIEGGESTGQIAPLEEEKENMPPAAPVVVQANKKAVAAPAPAEVTAKVVQMADVAPAAAASSSSTTSQSIASAAASIVGEAIVLPSAASSSDRFHMPNPGSNRIISLATKSADPAKCLDRIDDMYQIYYQQEHIYMARPYMDQQNDINRKMRSILVDWLVDVHNRFKLQPLTLWLTINILDRYLMSVQTMRSKLQLVGVSAMFISCKYEEIFPPFLRDCVCITDFAYEREDVLAMEKQILVTLNYNIFVPTGYHFLTRYLHSINAADGLRHLASYYAERNLQEYDSINYEPHMMAATSIFAAMHQQEESIGTPLQTMADLNKFWKILAIETGFQAEALLPYARVMIRHVNEEPETASRRRLTACKKKFSASKYMGVSALPLPTLLGGDNASMQAEHA